MKTTAKCDKFLMWASYSYILQKREKSFNFERACILSVSDAHKFHGNPGTSFQESTIPPILKS